VGARAARAPGQFGGVERKRLRFFIPAGNDAAAAVVWLHLSRNEKFSSHGLRGGEDQPRRQMANLIGRTVPQIGSLVRRRAKQPAAPGLIA